jgi:hypothetical protein
MVRDQFISSWLGRQLADHSRLEREMLRVRIPPEPFGSKRPRGAAGSARHPVKVETVGSNPIGGADIFKEASFLDTARYANWPSGQAQTLVNVGSNPSRAT